MGNKEIIIFGTKTFSLNVYYSLLEYSDCKVVAFTVDSNYYSTNEFMNCPVIPFENIEKQFPPDRYKMFIAVSYSDLNRNRERKYHEAKQKGFELANFIHPHSTVFSDLVIGDNCFISPNVSIQQGVTIGSNVVLRDNCNIGHDTVIKNNCYIGGGSAISGQVTIEKNVFLGKNATIKHCLTIGERCIIGAGVTMLKSTKAGEVYIAPSPIKYPFSAEGLI